MAKLEASRIPIQPPPVTSATTTVQTEDDALLQLQMEGELDGLFPEEEVGPRHPLEKFISYTRPNGDALSLRVVGHHPLWANYLWNGAHWMGDYICTNPQLFTGKVLELGAGAGLPSLLVAEVGGSAVVTDYPDEELIVNLEKNIEALLGEEAKRRISAHGYLWGSDPLPILQLNDDQKFDQIIMCDVIFNHSEHGKLLKSIKDCLKPEGVVWCVFSHYRPWLKEKDLAFLEMVKDELGMKVEFIDSKKYEHLIIEDKRGDPDVMRTVYSYCFRY